MASTNDKAQQRLFLGCFFSLIATAFGFIVRAMLLNDWRVEFNLSNEELGSIGGAGLYPFAISIILFSLIVDRIGYGTAMVFAFVGHLVSALITIFAGSFGALYVGTFIFALAIWIGLLKKSIRAFHDGHGGDNSTAVPR